MPFPNESTMFKPGQSGNLAGKPKGTKHLTTILRTMLDEEVEVKVNGKTEKKKFSEVLMRKVIQAANNGQKWAIELLLDRIDGKVAQDLNLEQNIVINWKKPSYLNDGDFNRSPGTDEGDRGDAQGLLPGIQDSDQSGRDAIGEDLRPTAMPDLSSSE